MQSKPESLFKSSLRTFMKALFGFLGVGIGFTVLLVLVAGTLGEDVQLERQTKQKVLTDAQGQRSPLGRAGPVILQIDIEGIIGTEGLTTEGIRQVLAESREGVLQGDRVKALLLNINSPGGTARDSNGIRRALIEYKERHNVPILAYVDGLCASGGLMIATAADRIVTTDDSIIGSVGVLGPTAFNLSAVLENLSIEALTLHAGKGKDALNPFRPWKEGESAFIKDLIDYQYALFVNTMVTARPELSREELVEEIGAKVLSADKAKEVGFIDAMDFDRPRALSELASSADLEEGDYHVVTLQGKNWISNLFSSQKNPGTITHQVQIIPGLPPELMHQFLYLYLPGLTQ